MTGHRTEEPQRTGAIDAGLTGGFPGGFPGGAAGGIAGAPAGGAAEGAAGGFAAGGTEAIEALAEPPGLPEPLPEPPGLPDPLPEPAVADLRLETVLGALSDPLRLRIVRKLLLESEDFDHTCGWFGLDRPKSSLTHHFRALREAGVTRQRQYGLERRSHVRVADLNARFPGLLDLVAAWTPRDGS